MEQKKFEEICRSLGECVKHSEALSADKRTQLVETEYQPIVLTKLHPKPGVCADCNKYQYDRVSQLHTLKSSGWRSWCNACKLSRLPGNDYFGAKPVPVTEPSQPELLEPQSKPIEIVPIVEPEQDFVVEVIVRDSRESLIREFVRTPVIPPTDQYDVQD